MVSPTTGKRAGVQFAGLLQLPPLALFHAIDPGVIENALLSAAVSPELEASSV